MLYANIHQLYCHILQTENFFIQHPFQPLSAVNTTTEPKVLQPKLHDIKKKRCFVPKYTRYTAIYCDRNIYSESTPSGCFQHAKIPLIPNFGVLLHRVTLPLHSADRADWTKMKSYQYCVYIETLLLDLSLKKNVIFSAN